MTTLPLPVMLSQDAVAFLLKLESSQIVIFQAIVESYEGLATIRTMDVKASLVAVITTPDQVDDCQRLLNSLKNEVPWSCAADLRESIPELMEL